MADCLEITRQIYRHGLATHCTEHELGYLVWQEDGTADYGEQVCQRLGLEFSDHVCNHHRKSSDSL